MRSLRSEARLSRGDQLMEYEVNDQDKDGDRNEHTMQKRVKSDIQMRPSKIKGDLEKTDLSDKLNQAQDREAIHHSKISSLSSVNRVFSYIAKTSGLNTSHLATAICRILTLHALESKRSKLSRRPVEAKKSSTFSSLNIWRSEPFLEILAELESSIDDLSEHSVIKLLKTLKLSSTPNSRRSKLIELIIEHMASANITEIITSDSSLISLMSVALSMPSNTDKRRQSQHTLVSKIFKTVKSRVEFMNNPSIYKLVTASIYLKDTDRRFCRSVTAVVHRRIRGMQKELLAKVMYIDSRLDEQAVVDVRADVLGIVGHVIEKKMLQEYRLSDTLTMIRAVKGLDQKGVFQGSRVLKDHLLSELIKGAKANFSDLIDKDNTKSRRYKSSLAVIQLIMKEFEGVYGNEEFSKIFKDFLINFPGGAKSIDLTLTRCEYLMDTLENESKTQSDEVNKLKVNFEQSSLKRQVIGLHNKLSQIAKRCNGKQLSTLVKLMGRMQDDYNLPIPNIVKKLATYRLVSDSYLFSIEELVSASDLLSRYVNNYDSLLFKTVNLLAFDDYSQLTQMEFAFRKTMSQRFESEMDWPGETKLVPGCFKDYAEAERAEIMSKPLFKINALYCNAALLLSKTSKADFLTVDKIKPPSSVHITKDHQEMLLKIKGSILSTS